MANDIDPGRRSERERIALLLGRDGEQKTREWVERTLGIYRAALDSDSYAASVPYRSRFEASVREFEAWLAAHPS